MDAVEGQCTRCLLELALPPAELVAQDWFGEIGGHQILQEIARGGMGIIYKAKRVRDGRTVALKVLLPGALSSQVMENRFSNEVRASMSLQHPNIIPTYEIGEEAGRKYFTMKYIDGSNLAEHLSRGPFGRMESVRLIATIADAVQYAHEQGILHRDIKPANIILDSFGSPWLGDFGVAKILYDEADLTRTIAVLGTPAYISPEQAAGRSKEVTPRSDVFSLGAVLYQLLTGCPPFSGESSFEVLQQVLNRDPIPPMKLNQEIDSKLSNICLKALSKDPVDRQRSAGELTRQLCLYMGAEPVSLGRRFRIARTSAWIQQNPAWAVMILAPTLLLLGALLGFMAGR